MPASSSAPTLVWLRQDLRLADNPALDAAVRRGRPVVPVFVLDDAAAGPWRPGGASRWWLHYSLAAFRLALQARDGCLVLRQGDAVEALTDLAERTGADSLYYNRAYEPHWLSAERGLEQAADRLGLSCQAFSGNLLFEPGRVLSKQGTPIKVFTPFWKACRRGTPPDAPLPAPDSVPAPADPDLHADDGGSLEACALLPTRPDWAGGLRATWTPGEEGAHDRFQAFLDEAICDYHDRRNRPDLPGTSRLSPHLHFGEITPRQIWYAVEEACRRQGGVTRGAEVFLSEIGWREFSYHLLCDNPDLPDTPLRPEFAAFPWAEDAAADIEAWQRGRTGFPIVDAGMRELWQTGWMHNRVRMITASFLIKDLLVPWQVGEAWFWDTLVDADLASNAASWQWTAGCGADAAPYFRVFNPVLQGEKFDPDGHYVRQWVPELAGMPAAWIHKPWEAPGPVCQQAGLVLGQDYPRPILDHARARRRALAAFERIKRGAGEEQSDGGARGRKTQSELPI